jgi:hypothetical protein
VAGGGHHLRLLGLVQQVSVHDAPGSGPTGYRGVFMMLQGLVQQVSVHDAPGSGPTG